MEPPSPLSPISQFLLNVLSHVGPSELPYPSADRGVIEGHILSLCHAFTTFEPRVRTWNHKDGRRGNLLLVEGTFEITYHGATHQIPVRIWLREYYPHYRPRVYLEGMIEGHHRARAVRDSGMVSIPYLRGWSYPDSDLAELVRHLSSYFSQDVVPVDFDVFPPPESSVAAVAALAVNDEPKKAFWMVERAKLVDMARQLRLSIYKMESSYVDFAIDEMIDDLRKGLEDEVIPLDQYSRSVASLSRERQFHRATVDHFHATAAHLASHFPSTIELPSEEPMSQKVVLRLPSMEDEETKDKAKKAITRIRGVEIVDEDLVKHTLIVIGRMKATELMKKVKKIGTVELLSIGLAKEEDILEDKYITS